MEKRYPRQIMATACVPWDEQNRFDEKMFRREVSALIQSGIKSIYLFGTAGEGHIVDDAQFEAIVRAFRSETEPHPDVLPMVGVIGLAPGDVKRRIALAAEIGIRDIQISFPSWGAVSQSEAFTFLRDMCNSFPELRFMHYNNGLRSRVKLGGAQYEALAQELPNLVAVKHTAATLREAVDLISRDLPIQFFFLENAYGYASLFGECSVLISLSNVNYRIAHEYLEAGIRRDVDKIVALEKDYMKCSDQLALLPGGKTDGAYDKLFIRYSIPEFPIRLFPPYEGVTEEQFAVFDRALREALPHWFE